MAKRKFTKNEMERLSSNKYVLKVSPSLVHFSVQFKVDFWTLLNQGMEPYDIVKELGVDPELLGETRIGGLKGMITRMAKSGKGFTDYTSCYKVDKTYITPESRIRYLEQQIAYKDQEIDFLKKIVSLDPESQKK